MSSSFIPQHGGQLRALAARFQLSESSLVDFSASINPQPPSDALIDALHELLRGRKIITNYPDIEYLELKRVIARYAGVDEASIAIGNGVMPLLAATIRALRIPSCMVLVPAFAEYRRTLAMCDVVCNTLTLEEVDGFRIDCNRILMQLQSTGAKALLLANPHSPSGSLVPAGELRRLQEAAAAAGVVTIVDEAFIDYIPEGTSSLIAAGCKDLIVLRSVTKFFSMPGARVAYAIAHPETRSAIEASMPLWPVDSIAAEAARLAIEDRALAITTREANARERDWLAAQMRALGLTVFPGKANYLLVKIDNNRDGLEFWRRLLIEHNIVVRSCANFEGLSRQFFRVGVRSRPEDQCLVAALSRMMEESASPMVHPT